MSRLDRHIATALAVAAVCAPPALGATPPAARFALECLTASAVLIWAITKPRPWQLIALPFVSLILCGLQVIPLPRSLVLSVASGSGMAWQVAVAGAAPSWITVSVDPHATAVACGRLFLGLATIASVADLAKMHITRRILQSGLAISALVVWGLGVVFPPQRHNTRSILGGVDFSGPIEFWLTPLKRPLETAAFGYRRAVAIGGDSYPVIDWGVGDGFGSYVVSNHFAGAVVLTLPAAMAWLMFLFWKRMPAAASYAAACAALATAAWVVGGLAGSRAGVCALLAGGFTCLAFAAEQRLARRVFAGAAVMCVAGICAGTVLLYGRWQGVADVVPEAFRKPVMSMLNDSRAAATAIAFRVFRGSPFFGTGLSTFGEISSNKEWGGVPWYFAHNDYAQWAAETGLFGVAMAAAGGRFLLKRAASVLKQPWQPERLLDAGAWGALVGIAAHSAFDWNLHVPANAFLACIVVGLALSSGSPAADAARPPAGPVRARRDTSRQRGLTVGFCIGCLVAIGLLGRDYQAARVEGRLRRAVTAARAVLVNPAAPSAEAKLQAAVDAGERMAKLDPKNPQLAVLLGQANMFLSVEPQPIDDADERRQAAKAWFRRARESSAVCVGVPEPR